MFFICGYSIFYKCCLLKDFIICIFYKLINIFDLFVSGQLYGLEKFWAFLKYYKNSQRLQVTPKLKEYLSKFKSIEDFRVFEVCYLIYSF